MAAVVNARYHSGASEGAGADAETGIKFNREDTQTGTTPVPKPTATGTAYSWLKTGSLRVTSGGGATSLSNRKTRVASAPTAGLKLHFKDGGDTYAQSTSGNMPADAGTDGAVPATFTEMSTTFQTWDATSEAATDSTRNGNLIIFVLGVDSTYAGGAGSAIALPNIELQYDEA